MNNENLISLADRSPEELKEITRKGGIASGEARRERKKLKEELISMLSAGDIQERICLALVGQALKGDVVAFKTLRDSIGEREADSLTIAGAKANAESVREYMEQNYGRELTLLHFEEVERIERGEKPKYKKLVDDMCGYSMISKYMPTLFDNE